MNRINTEAWGVWEQNSSPMLLIATLNPAFKELREYLGSCFANTPVIFEYDNAKNYQAKWLFRPEEWRSLGQKMLDMLLCPSYSVAFNTGVELAEELLLKRSNEILEISKNYSLEEALNVFEEILQLYYDYYKFGWFTEPIQYHTEHIISNYITKHYKGNIPVTDAINALLATEEESFTVDIIKDLFECSKIFDEILVCDEYLQKLVSTPKKGLEFQNNIVDYVFSSEDKIFDTLLKKLQMHSNKFHWKKNNYFATSFVSSKDVLFELIEAIHLDNKGITKYYLEKIETISKSKSEQLKIKSQVFAELPLYYQTIVSIANSVGSVLIDTRKKNIMITNSAFDALLKIVSQKTNYSLEDIHLLIPQELRSFVDNPSEYNERFAARRKLFVCLQTDFPIVPELIDRIDPTTKESILSWRVHPTSDPYTAEGIDAEKVLEELNLTMNLFDSPSEQKKHSQHLHGVVAFHDKSEPIIEGIVRVIRNPNNEYLSNGEILVAPNTTPDYLNAINKSTAIITNYGGLACHAAITARELKKPCIIDTKFATDILRTGQKIRINFNNGNIEIIS